MRTSVRVLACAMFFFWIHHALAQTDALVVAPSGNVGVVTAAPNESVMVSVAAQPPYADVPRRCQRDVPVRIVMLDAATGAQLLFEQQFLTAASRLFTATLAPVGGEGVAVQVAVLTRASLVRCIAIEIAAVGPNGIRRFVPDE